jgi:hypothetical protein
VPGILPPALPKVAWILQAAFIPPRARPFPSPSSCHFFPPASPQRLLSARAAHATRTILLTIHPMAALIPHMVVLSPLCQDYLLASLLHSPTKESHSRPKLDTTHDRWMVGGKEAPLGLRRVCWTIKIVRVPNRIGRVVRPAHPLDELVAGMAKNQAIAQQLVT